MIASVLLWLWPVGLFVFTYIMAPGYLIPLLNHPLARIIVIVLFLLHTLWCGLFGASKLLDLPGPIKVVLGIFAVFSLIVMTLVPMLGPAILTIVKALGPIGG